MTTSPTHPIYSSSSRTSRNQLTILGTLDTAVDCNSSISFIIEQLFAHQQSRSGNKRVRVPEYLSYIIYDYSFLQTTQKYLTERTWDVPTNSDIEYTIDNLNDKCHTQDFNETTQLILDIHEILHQPLAQYKSHDKGSSSTAQKYASTLIKRIEDTIQDCKTRLLDSPRSTLENWHCLAISWESHMVIVSTKRKKLTP